MAGQRGSYRAALNCVLGVTAALTHSAGTGANNADDPSLEYIKRGMLDDRMDRSTVNPFGRVEGERLERGSFRNHAGMLIRGASMYTLDPGEQAVVAHEIPLLEAHVEIASLVDGTFSHQGLSSWWESLGQIASTGVIHLQERVVLNTPTFALMERQPLHEFSPKVSTNLTPELYCTRDGQRGSIPKGIAPSLGRCGSHSPNCLWSITNWLVESLPKWTKCWQNKQLTASILLLAFA